MKKITGEKTYNWGIPAYRSKDGFKTCPNAAACAKGCYATMGAYTFGNVAKVFEARLTLAQSPDFSTVISAEIVRRKVTRLRIHDSGDFFSPEYLQAWLTIMHANPSCEFYAYTKMISMFKEYTAKGLIPSNFKIIYSYGGTEDRLIDRNTDRHSWVFSSLENLQAAGYSDASKDDSVALDANPKVGLIYHGTKNIENTDWAKVKAKDVKNAA
jgi:hypothetical protein